MKTRKWVIAIRTAIPIGLLVLLGLPTIPRPAEVRVSRSTVEVDAPDLSGGALLMPDEAAAAALNRWETTADGYRLRHPRHTATFTPEGLQFMPRRGGLEWAWRLTFVGAGDAPLAGVATGPVPPTRLAQGVAYPRGGLVEQYQAQKNAIEQQFLIPRPLPLGGADLVIAGAVESAGAFEATATDWLWQAEQTGVRLGNVRVYDVQGATLPATMAVTADATRIVVDGNALAQAAYPVTIDPEIGANDFRLSFMGRDWLFDALQPAVAYNSQANQYLVVWYGDDNTGSLVDGEYEIFGQRVDATTGQPIGSNFRISDMGGTGNAAYGAYAPAVAYNSTDNQYLVVWSGDDDAGSLVDEEFEIFGQRFSSSACIYLPLVLKGYTALAVGAADSPGIVAETPTPGATPEPTAPADTDAVAETPMPMPTQEPSAPALPLQLEPINGQALSCVASVILRWDPVADPGSIAEYRVQVEVAKEVEHAHHESATQVGYGLHCPAAVRKCSLLRAAGRGDGGGSSRAARLD